MNRLRFSDDWRIKVEKWAEEHSVMLKRYDELRNYNKLMVLADELTPYEQHQFYHCECREGEIGKELPAEWPEDDILADDWPQAS